MFRRVDTTEDQRQRTFHWTLNDKTKPFHRKVPGCISEPFYWYRRRHGNMNSRLQEMDKTSSALRIAALAGFCQTVVIKLNLQFYI